MEASTKDQQAAFDAFDGNGDGKLSKQECGMAIRALSKNPLESELNSAWASMPDDLSFAQYQQLFSKAWLRPDQQDGDLRKFMQLLDHDDNGKVSESELRQLLLTVGDILTHGEVDLLFEEVPIDDQGYFKHDQLVDTLVTGWSGK